MILFESATESSKERIVLQARKLKRIVDKNSRHAFIAKGEVGVVKRTVDILHV